MQDELYLSGWEIEEISNTLTKHGDEVNTLVEKAASERAARYAYDHPKLPKGFVTIEQLQGDLDLGDLRDEVEDFDFDGDITDAFSETADYKVDDNYHALLSWLPDHTEWLEQAEFDGLLEGCKGDIYKMVQMAQYECFKSDLYDHREDICRYGTLDQLRDMGVYAIRESLADEILNDLSYDEDYLPLEGLTAMGKHYELGDENRFVHDLYNNPELCAAPRYMEQSFGCPSEEYEKEEGTLPHDFTTGKWRVHLIYPGERYGLDGCLTYELNAYSGAPAAAHRASYPLVEFYDTSQDATRFPGGQFVSRYYVTDLLEDNSIAVSLDTMLKNGNQFSLDGGIPAWTVEGDDLAKVNDFLKKSCMEFCGSLPGDEKGEDGYSLSGEAKDATASRNGLSRNQMGIEEKAAECKEAATALANGNAL